MKMRKKLAALLAAAMIASVMPMTAFATTNNRVTNDVKVAKDGSTQGKAPILVIKNEFGDVGAGVEKDFYVVIEGAEFLTPGAILYSFNNDDSDADTYHEDDAILNKTNGYYTVTAGDLNGLKFRRDGDTELAINIASMVTTTGSPAWGNDFKLPIIAKVTDEIATVRIDSNETAVGEAGNAVKKYVFARTGASKTDLTVTDAPGIYTGRNLKLAKINLKEFYSTAMENAKLDRVKNAAGKYTRASILVELDDVDYEFVVPSNNEIKATDVTFKRGFATNSATLGIDYNGTDKQAVVITFDPTDFADAQLGELDIQLYVDSISKKPAVGKMNAEISGDIVTNQTVVLANVAEFGVTLAADKEYEFVTGQDEKVVFHLNEIIEDSMITGRMTEFMLPEGVYFEEKANGKPAVELKTGKMVEDTDIEAIRDKTGKIEGFTIDLVATNKVDKYKFEATLDITSAFEGDITLKAEGRAIGAEVEATLATTVAPVTVTMNPVQVKPGFKVQTGGKIVIAETDKARLMQGKTLVVNLEHDSGMKITDAKIAVTEGDLRPDDIDVVTRDGQIQIKIKRKSKIASTIEITDIELRLDRSVPQGSYELHVGGDAISELAINTVEGTPVKTYAGKAFDRKEVAIKSDISYGNDVIKSKDFAIVGDPITGVKSEVVFTIGSETLTIDGVTEMMDAKAYIKDGRTMVPLRYLARALGVDAESIKFNSGIVTIFVGNGNVVQVQVNSKMLVTNGMSIPMVAAAEIIDGRTYVPVTEIGGVFGVNGTWDAATQTATFK